MDCKTELIYGNTSEEIFITVIIPTYKRNSFLLEAIESILTQKDFEKYHCELLIISNDPDDDMEEIVKICKKSTVSIYRNTINIGMISNINRGISLAKGKYVAFLHDDDLLLQNYLSTIVPLLKYDWDCLVTSRYIMSNKYRNDTKYKVMNFLTLPRYIYRKNVTRLRVKHYAISGKNIYQAPTCGTIFKKESLCEYGLFEDISGLAWDLANFINFNRNYKVGLVHKYTGIYRTYTGVTNNKSTLKDFYKQSVLFYNEESKNYTFMRFFKDEYNYINIKLINPDSKHNTIKVLAYSVFTLFYFYFNNLDGSRLLPKEYYAKGRK